MPSLLDSPHFPPISDLPTAPFPPPTKHTCLLGEITNITTNLRVRAEIKDRAGAPATVAFHDDRSGMGFLPRLRDGWTLAVLYPAVSRTGAGGAEVRVEEEGVGRVRVLEAGLEEVGGAVEEVRGRERRCEGCGGGAASICNGCRGVWYCGKDCQVRSWKAGHKARCKILKEARWFTEKDWETFTGTLFTA